ncbi:Protein CBG14493 [Caenorhabditis briggsae]|uniref:Protein CBG14493 n=1 Tax=Caenorhabditis briggsae TaxID=6238 RepID=A8XK20_CAEBR|nr:Protein CBG14493 [Caenorhabditis briggsae]CAP32996.2 Protein CBG14493 [Caenorhabditis briggsae]
MCAISKCAFLAVLSCLLAVDCASVGPMPALNHFQDIPQELHHIKTKHRVKRTYIDDMDCAPQEFEMVHTIMDRICHLCHELHSHFAPNTRSCMKIFSAKKPVQSVEPTAPVPLYSEDVQTLDDIKERRRRI